MFGQEETRQNAVRFIPVVTVAFSFILICSPFVISFIVQADKLEKLRERMIKVRELFRDTDSTEFVIVTIPTV